MVRKQLTEKERQAVIEKSNNKCCVCQYTPMQIHHIDGDSSNNEFDNLAPLCANCHERAGLNLEATSNMANNLTPNRVKALRNMWYNICEKTKEGKHSTSGTVLAVKTFVFSLDLKYLPRIGWAKMFPGCEGLKRDQVIEKIFSDVTTDQIVKNLEAMKVMYQNSLRNEEFLLKFKNLCLDIGINFDDLN